MSKISTIATAIALMLLPVISAADQLFGNDMSEGEHKQLQQQADSTKKAQDALADLEIMAAVQEMHGGNCAAGIEAEGKANNGDATSQMLLGILYHEGICYPKDGAKIFQRGLAYLLTR